MIYLHHLFSSTYTFEHSLGWYLCMLANFPRWWASGDNTRVFQGQHPHFWVYKKCDGQSSNWREIVLAFRMVHVQVIVQNAKDNEYLVPTYTEIIPSQINCAYLNKDGIQPVFTLKKYFCANVWTPSSDNTWGWWETNHGLSGVRVSATSLIDVIVRQSINTKWNCKNNSGYLQTP